MEHGRFMANHACSMTAFLICMLINKFHCIDKWLPVARAMPCMIAGLSARSKSGLLGSTVLVHDLRTILTMQYWRQSSS